MIVYVAVLTSLLTGVGVSWLVVRRPLPVALPSALPLGDPRPVERAVWSRSARELYRTVQGLVEDLDVGGLATAGVPDGIADPEILRAWFTGAVTRAEGAAAWAAALREQALGVEAERSCERLVAGMVVLTDLARSALAHPTDPDRARLLAAARDQVQADAEGLSRVL